MTIDGQPTIVRQSDGIHLNDAGSALAAKLVLAASRPGLHALSARLGVLRKRPDDLARALVQVSLAWY